MRARVFSFVCAALAMFGGAALDAQRPAASQTLAQVQNYTTWAAEFQRVLGNLITPLQEVPLPPVDGMSRVDRRAWAESARTWAASAHASFTSGLAALEQLPPLPQDNVMTDQLRAAVDSSRGRLRESFNAADRISGAYIEMADAVERNQMDRVTSLRVVTIDAALITARMFQDVNATQAAAMMQGNPQRLLAQSYADSYDVMWTVLNFKRDLLRGDLSGRAAAADAVAQNVEHMHFSINEGRDVLASINAQLNAPPEVSGIDPQLHRRLRLLAATFPASFQREEAIAAAFNEIANLLRDPRDISDVEPMIDTHLDTFATLDAERVLDVQGRMQIMAAP